MAKESITSKRRSSAGWMPDRIGRWSVEVAGRDLVTMRKISFKYC